MITTDHQTIKGWVEQRGGHPARLEGTAVRGSAGVILIDYGDTSAHATDVESITWGDFFEGFEENRLAFLYPDDTDETRFAKLVSRDSTGVEVLSVS